VFEIAPHRKDIKLQHQGTAKPRVPEPRRIGSILSILMHPSRMACSATTALQTMGIVQSIFLSVRAFIMGHAPAAVENLTLRQQWRCSSSWSNA
jgi:hypothetical protein